MDQTGRDALTEVHSVIDGLRQFLLAVGKSTNFETQADLCAIEKQLECVISKISLIYLQEVRVAANVTPFRARYDVGFAV